MKETNDSLTCMNANIKAKEKRKTITLTRCMKVIRNVRDKMKTQRMTGEEENSKETGRKRDNNYPKADKEEKKYEKETKTKKDSLDLKRKKAANSRANPREGTLG